MSSRFSQYSLIAALILLPLFGFLLWRLFSTPTTLQSTLKPYEKTGEEVLASLSSLPVIAPVKAERGYTVIDDTKEGIQISYPNQQTANNSDQLTNNDQQLAANSQQSAASSLKLSFPEDIGQQPLEVTLPSGKSFSFTNFDPTAKYASSLIGNPSNLEVRPPSRVQALLERIFPKQSPGQFLQYQSEDGRKLQYYAYGADQASGEKKLKHWTLYTTGTGEEQESYTFTNAKLKLNENGTVSVYYFDQNELKNNQDAQGVEESLLDRAARVLANDAEADILSGSRPHDAYIPAPYALDKDGGYHELEWEVSDDHRTLSVNFQLPITSYPLALDPTLSFTAPAISNTGDVITGDLTSTFFGYTLQTGDFNTDGRIDLAVGAYYYTNVIGGDGAVYLFYSDGSLPNSVKGADVMIKGAPGSVSFFGYSLAAGDFNADGRTDLAAGGYFGGAATGGTWIFYNDGSYPSAANRADVQINGPGVLTNFGYSLAAGDFNADGKTDLAVGANQYSTSTGRAYIFYADGTTNFGTATCTGSAPAICQANNADIIITGGATNNSFGNFLTAGDFNFDGRIDLAVGASHYSSNTGRAYLFYNDGSIPTTAATADVIITGEASSNSFGFSLIAGDFNFDGRIDLAVGAVNYSTSTGRAYIFYNDGSIPTAANSADVIITGEATNNYFSSSLTSGDFNSDGRIDLVVGANGYSSNTGRAYIFYNDGSYPTTAATADVIITGEATSNFFGTSLAAGDFNADGRTDLAVGASGYAGSRGRVYLFYSQNGQVNTNISLTGQATGNYFGYAMTSGDFNADGRNDLAVGAYGYSTNTGRVYIFYGDGQWPTGGATADVTITGEAIDNYFSVFLTAGDFNSDGRTDLAVGSNGYASFTGRVYIFYNDGSIPTTAGTADVIITGEATGDRFGGASFTTGDFNSDGRTDLAAVAYTYSSNTGRVYIFYNDGSIPTTATTADVIITGEATNHRFGSSLTTGDFNSDGKTDLAVGAAQYSSNTGRVYLFYNDGSFPTTADTADVIITGEASSYLGYSLSSGDFNSDGRTDLAVGSNGYASFTGRVYIFYNDGSIPTTATTADIIITGEASSQFGSSFTSGDFNADGRIDLAVGAPAITTNTGKVYLFYNDGSIPSTATTADVILTGETTNNYFGASLVSGDLNSDGRTDLAVGAYGYSTNTGRVYLYETRENFAWQLQKFADPTGLRVSPNFSGEELRITGEASSSFGNSLTTADLNSDGKVDLVVGASSYSSSTGRTYIFYNDGSLTTGAPNADVIITGESSSSQFGASLTSGDFNADGRTDLAVGASSYSSNMGRVYLFYNDGSIPTTAATADVIITGEGGSAFGISLASGDYNADGKADLAVGAKEWLGNEGRAYVFYNDSSIPTTAASADVIITSEGWPHRFGRAVAAGDFNADGKTDLVVGAEDYAGAGRVYIFYNGAIVTENASGADVKITADGGAAPFGFNLATGDFNADGRTDLAVGGYAYSSLTGRVYIFYNDGSIPTTASTADVIITGGATSDYFGYSLTSGDWNADGKTDLAVGARQYSSSTGRVYLFYNDGSIPTTAATADLILTGESTSNFFGTSLISGDWNSDGKTDLAVGASGYSSSRGRIYLYTFNDNVITGAATSNSFGWALTSGDFNSDGRIDLAVGARDYSTFTGRVYLFYNDGSIPTTANSADVIITGEATSNYFGHSLTSGDFNFDGRADLAVGANQYSTSTGRVYLFYNDGSIPTTAATADVIMTGEASSQFGGSLVTGDFNADGRADLAVGANQYSTSTGRVYLFYNDGSIPTTAATADVIMTGEATSNYFGRYLTSGDFNADGRIDLAVGAYGYSSFTGRVYIFYNDGSIPTTAATADVIISGQTTSNNFGTALIAGDFNTDGRIDLAVGATQYISFTGRVYLFYNDGSIPTSAATADEIITGETTSTSFGVNLTSGDFNSDGRTDLAVGATGLSSFTGRVYLFYNDGSIPTTAVTADVIITGEATSSYFGDSLNSGDFNSDGWTDLAVGASGYSSSTGRAYIFITEAAVASTGPEATKVKGTAKFKGGIKFK